MLWSLFALLTGGAVFAILWPLARTARREATAPDVAFYQAKLEEIARDQARDNSRRRRPRRRRQRQRASFSPSAVKIRR